MEGRRTQDFSKGRVYMIRNTVNELVYIGSTCQTLARRMGVHRFYAKTQNSKLYVAMRELGIENFYIEIFEDFSCERREQLLAREGAIIREFAAKSYNMTIPGRTVKEYCQDNAEKRRASTAQWTINNIEKVRATTAKWREAHADEIREKNRIRDQNPERKATQYELAKIRYAANRELYNAKQREYRMHKKAKKLETVMVSSFE